MGRTRFPPDGSDQHESSIIETASGPSRFHRYSFQREWVTIVAAVQLAASLLICATRSAGCQSLVGYQAAILPSLPMMMVEREWVRVLASPGVMPTLKNWVTSGRSFSEG